MAKKPNALPLPKVQSSAFSHAGYDPAARTLTVVFKGSGKKWVYDDVSHERGTSFEGSSSMGRYFAEEIKPNHIGREVFD